MRHAVITRIYYATEDSKLEQRLDLYKSMVLPRLLNQTCQDFEIWIICREEHISLMESIHPRITPCALPTFPAAYGGIKEDPVDPAAMPRFEIQTGMDSDDLVSPNYIARIKEEVEKSLNKSLVVSFQPYKLDMLTMKRYKMVERYYSQKCSPFITLYQPDGERYENILNLNHTYISGWCSNVVTIPEGYADMLIHGTNWATHLNPNLGEV